MSTEPTLRKPPRSGEGSCIVVSMTDEKKAGAEKDGESAHTVATVKISASEVQKLVARSAVASHDFGAPNEAGLRKCTLCGRLVPAGREPINETCPKAPGDQR
jgi:hypothetical protein